MPKKKPAADAGELSLEDRERIVETVAQIFIGMYCDLQRLKHPESFKPRTQGSDTA